MKTPPSIFINPRSIARIYSTQPVPGISMVEYVPKAELDYVQKELEKLLQEKREGLLTRREIFPRG